MSWLTRQDLKVKLVQAADRQQAVAPRHRARPGPAQLNSERELQDTPAVRGMINKISYLVLVL